MSFKKRMRTVVGRTVRVASHASPIYRGRTGKITDNHGWEFLVEFNDDRPGLDSNECWVNLRGLRAA